MKKLMFAAAMVAAGIVVADVESANVVGYSTTAVSAGAIKLCAMQYDTCVGADTTVSEVTPDIAPVCYDDESGDPIEGWLDNAPSVQVRVGDGWHVLYYAKNVWDDDLGEDGDLSGEVAMWCDDAGDATVAKTEALAAGTGVWFCGAKEADVNFSTAGQVKDSSVAIEEASSALKLVASPVPVAFQIGDTSKVTWDLSAPVCYDDESGDPIEGWLDSAAQIQVRVGDGWHVLYYAKNVWDDDLGEDGDLSGEVAMWCDDAGDATVAKTEQIGIGVGFWLKDPNGFSFTVKNPLAK